MAETFTLKITGVGEELRKIYSFRQGVGDRVVYGSLRLGANVVLKEARLNAPILTGKLKRGIRVARSRIHRGKLSTDLIGVYISIRKGKSGPFYGRFQEDGWKAGKTLVPEKKFIDNAFNDKREEAVRIIERSAIAGAELLARKLGL